MENQMETGMKEIVKKEENSDRFSTVANAEDRKKPLEKAKRSIGSMFRRSVKVEISPADVENTECGQLPKPLNQEPSQPASSSSVMKKEETSDNLSTMVLPETSLSTYPCQKPSAQNSRKRKILEPGTAQCSTKSKFTDVALVDTSVSPITSAVPAVLANGFMSTSKLNGADKAKRPATVKSSPIEVNIIGLSSPDSGRNKHSVWESGSEDHNDGDSDVDNDLNETGQFTCLDCAAAYETDAEFKEHIASHPGYRRFKCTVCEKRFPFRSNLMVHMRIHTGEKPFECNVCEKKFTVRGHLTIHKRTHTGVRPFKCNVCKKKCTTNGNLTIHKRIHTGVKAFKCDVCDKCFTLNRQLTVHMRIHTGEKPFKCNVCKKCFSESGSLAKHKLIHTGGKPYECMSCGLCFRQKSNLLRHKRTQHSDPDADTQPDVSHLQHLLSSSLQAVMRGGKIP